MMRLGGLFILIVFFTGMNLNIAYAQSLCADGNGTLNRPAPGANITSNLGPRSCAGCSPNHPGTDYAFPHPENTCGRVIPGPPPSCVLSNANPDGTLPYQGSTPTSGYGYRAQFDCGTNIAGQRIQIQYAHLDSANAYSAASNTLTVGDSGAGGCHLDFILTIDGTPIDAQCSTGTVIPSNYVYGNSSDHHGATCPIAGQINLCDGTVTEQLLQQAMQARNGVTSGPNMSSTGGGTAPQPPNGPTGTGGTGTGGTGTGGTGTGGTTPPPPVDPGLLSYDPRAPYVGPPSTADPCNNSTCITNSMIVKAKNNAVDNDDVLPKIEFLWGSCADSEEPTKTGLTNLVRDGRNLNEEDDQFCITQGCSYIRGEGCI